MAEGKRKVDVGLPVPLGDYSYLPPVQTGMNDAVEEKAMNPVLAWLAGQGIDVAAEQTGIKDVLRERGAGLLNMLGIGDAQAANVQDNTPVQTGFEPTTSVVAQDVIGTPIPETSPSYVPDSAIPMEGRRLPTGGQVLVRQDWEGPGRGPVAGVTGNQDGVRQLPPISKWAMDDNTPPASDAEVDEVIKKSDPDSMLGRLWDSTLGNEEWRLRKAMILNSMRLNPDAALTQAFASRIKDLRDKKGANRTADYLENIGQKDAADLIRQNPSIAGEILKEFIGGGTTAFRTLQSRAKAAGLEEGTPAYQNFMRTGGQSFAGGLQVGSIPAGYQLVERDGGVRLEPIPGGEAERKQAEAVRQRQTQGELATRAGGVVFEDIGRLEKLVQEDPILNPVLGVTGAIASFIPGTNRVNAESLAQTIRANIGFDRLQQMREASPTGGALGQVSNQELSTLQSVLGNLSLSQSQDQVLQNLNRLKKIYADILKKAQAYPNAADFGFGAASQEATSNDPMGIL
jgi:hypothetical protein